MKEITIGRDEACDLCLEDSSAMISRLHAKLRFYPFGKIELVPLGRNKTYLNGKELAIGRPYKVSRRDVVSFAKIKSLDWKNVANPYAKLWRWVGVILIAIVLLFVALATISRYETKSSASSNIDSGFGSGALASPTTEKKDSVGNQDTKHLERFKFPQKEKKGAKAKPTDPEGQKQAESSRPKKKEKK